ncbi:glutamine amidotransferase-related protein [Streptomyces sp. BK340]|uniref:CTP synthase C-terminal region-related (seleno)protein n=1 Tax=Streptomyces sp. BK340 TaxID=2572903 RepID=UPI00119F2317|nr:hypothetical protein [Streptomyces sp. BK340]
MPPLWSLSTPRLALVGDRSPSNRAHVRMPWLLDELAQRDRLVLDAYWISSEDAEAPDALDGFDAIWLVPGSPYRSEAGAVAAIRTARERKIPFLGTCGGFQHALVEYARNVCGLTNASHAENQPLGDDKVIIPMGCSLVGHEGTVLVEPGSLAERVLGAERTVERYHCSYGPNPDYVDILRGRGLCFSGADDAGEVRIAELPDHPFFFATLFQPELASPGTLTHPIMRAMATAANEHAAMVRI